jgi:hypothetical protein
MHVDFSSIHNHHEQNVFSTVLEAASDYPDIEQNEDLLIDVACIALNRLHPRYIRHKVDFLFYLTERERAAHDKAIHEAVAFALAFVQSHQKTHELNSVVGEL